MSLLPPILLALHAALWVTGAVLAWRHHRGEDTHRALVALVVVSTAGITLSFAMRLQSAATNQPPESGELAFGAALLVATIWLRRLRSEAEGREASAGGRADTDSGDA